MIKLLIIVGPTSSGKSELAIKLAKKFKGEIISCDSRQIYKGMDLGTGKVEGKRLRFPSPSGRGARGEGFKKNADQKCFIYKTIPHHCIDYINPRQQYSAALFKRDAKKAIADILARGKLPIFCGGTAHWIDAVVYDQQLPDVRPNAKLRKQLEKLSTECLFARISRLDPGRAKTIDRFNKRRLIRALEIIMVSGKPVAPVGKGLDPSLPYDPFWLGINPPQPILFSKIKTRLKQRLKAGMIAEVKSLHQQLPLTPSSAKRGNRVPLPFSQRSDEALPARQSLGDGGAKLDKGEAGRGLSWHRLESFGLEYKFVALYLQKKISYDKMFEQLFIAIKHYTKRQMTWWKRNKEIRWINKQHDAEKLVKKFLL